MIPNLQLRDFSKRLKNGHETVVINETSVFEPLKFYCVSKYVNRWQTAVKDPRSVISLGVIARESLFVSVVCVCVCGGG